MVGKKQRIRWNDKIRDKRKNRMATIVVITRRTFSEIYLYLMCGDVDFHVNLCFDFSLFLFYLQSFDRIPEPATHEFNEEDEDAFDEEEESKFCTLPRSSNGFTIRHVCLCPSRNKSKLTIQSLCVMCAITSLMPHTHVTHSIWPLSHAEVSSHFYFLSFILLMAQCNKLVHECRHVSPKAMVQKG